MEPKSVTRLQPDIQEQKPRRRYVFLMSTPALLGLFMFLVIPFFMAVGMSFTDQRLLSPNETSWVGLRNYDRLLNVSGMVQEPVRDEAGQLVLDGDGQVEYPRLRTLLRSDPAMADYKLFSSWDLGEKRYIVLAKDPHFIQSFINTLLFVLLVVPLQCGLALALALLINRQLRGIFLYRTVFFSPVVTSIVVVSIVWSFLYHKDLGLFNHYLQAMSFGLIGPIDWLGDPAWSMPSIVIMSAWQAAGVQMLIFLAGLQGISPDLYEAADLDGAGPWSKFWHITLPGLRNTVVFVVISTTIQAFGLFTQVDVMTQGGPQGSTSTVMYHAVTKGFREQDIAYGSAISVIFFLVILGIALFQKRLFDSKGDK
ncbi:carbohydrate ABC transporter permease [Marinobacterium sedimentorum]|uniref:carbohydrate ABC transporter permease n=1 Tax=Marinobacterium sedimentorum TaxID=2927804 RepID=UPI0020C6463E|nr:sugar ABC transporter permease [Marinobacterium sedimentorum]MCP8686721.1 sugar ABC transporter permease [Marinobacterium sedimentorum]